MNTRKPELQLRDLSKILNLPYHSQDWGIGNSDPSRVREFIRVYDSKPNMTMLQRYNLYELIVASANEGLLDESLLSSDLEVFKTFLSSHANDVPVQLDYWISLPDAKEYPVANIIREICLDNEK